MMTMKELTMQELEIVNGGNYFADYKGSLEQEQENGSYEIMEGVEIIDFPVSRLA